MLPSRESARLRGYDYAQPGAYFITICAHQRRHLFGAIDAGHQAFTPLGYLLGDCWLDVPAHYNNVTLDLWVRMPNHFHALLLIHQPAAQSTAAAAKSLGNVVGGFKSAVSRKAAELGLGKGAVWQTRYHDHIIRHERALNKVREYIANNPAQWSLDRENQNRQGVNEFYGWLEAYTKALHQQAEK